MNNNTSKPMKGIRFNNSQAMPKNAMQPKNHFSQRPDQLISESSELSQDKGVALTRSQKSTNTISPFLVFFAIVTVLCTFVHSGYQFTIINLPHIAYIDTFINQSIIERYYHGDNQLSEETSATLWSFLVACQGIGCLIGTVFGKLPAEALGRKLSVTLLLPSFYVVGYLMQIICKATDRFELIFVGRLVAGVGTGLTFSVVPTYLMECSPPHYRGFIGSFGFMGVLIGVAIARLVGTYLATETTWPICLGLGIVPAVLLMMLTPCWPQSPKSLLFEKGDITAAIKTIHLLWGNHVNLRNTVIQIMKEEQITKAETVLGIRNMFKKKVYRMPVLLAMVANAAAASTGLYVFFSYSTKIFDALPMLTEEKVKKLTVAMLGVSLGSGLLGCFLVQKVPRRPLIYYSLPVVMAGHALYLISNILIQFCAIHWPTYLALTGIMVTLAATNAGIANVSIYLPSEVSLQKARSLTQSMASATQAVGMLLSQLIFDEMFVALHYWLFLFFFTFTGIFLVFIIIELPETRGKMLNEITLKWRKDPPNCVEMPKLVTQSECERTQVPQVMVY